MPDPSLGRDGGEARRRTHIGARTESRLVAAISHSSIRMGRIAAHPLGASLCLALGYMVLCSAYIFFSGRIAADAAWSLDQLRRIELLKGLTFVIVTGTAFFGFAVYLLKRIAVQQQHLALIFEGVSDSLFLLQVEADGIYRFLCVNAAFLKMTGLARDQVVGRRIEEVFPAVSQVQLLNQCREALQGRKSVRWEDRAAYPAGQRAGEVTLTPLADGTGTLVQLAGVVRA